MFAALAQQKRRPAQNGKVEGANPSRGTILSAEWRVQSAEFAARQRLIRSFCTPHLEGSRSPTQRQRA